MPTTTALSPFTSYLELKSYCEDQDFLCNGEPEPNSRSQTLIYHFENKKWWIKVTFKGAISSFPQNKTKRERRKEYQDFVKLFDFDPLALLDDTVSEVILSEDPGTIDSINLRHDLEDTSNRVIRLVGNL